MITGPLCKAARALVEVSRAKLSVRSEVDRATIEQFERGILVPPDDIRARLQSELEELGAVFIPEKGSAGVGVHLKFSESVTDRLRVLVDEGGTPSSDAVP